MDERDVPVPIMLLAVMVGLTVPVVLLFILVIVVNFGSSTENIQHRNHAHGIVPLLVYKNYCGRHL